MSFRATNTNTLVSETKNAGRVQAGTTWPVLHHISRRVDGRFKPARNVQAGHQLDPSGIHPKVQGFMYLHAVVRVGRTRNIKAAETDLNSSSSASGIDYLIPMQEKNATKEGMKAVILAGGLGFRLAEEPSLRPEPMVEVEVILMSLVSSGYPLATRETLWFCAGCITMASLPI